MDKINILTISSANMDLNMKVSKTPGKGQTIMGEKYAYVPGGKGANSATTVAKLGENSIFCTALGNDSNGKTLLKVYKDLNIDTTYISVLDNYSTGLATVTVDGDGDNSIVVFSGANMAITANDAIKAIENSKPDAVFSHFEIPYETIVKVSEYCNQNSIPYIIDAGPASKSMDLTKLSKVTVFSPNETETEIFTGIKPTNKESGLEAAKVLSTLVKSDYFVIKMGSKGVGVYDGNDFTLIPTYKIDVVDTTAAGDSFTAAMTIEFIKSKDIYRACKFGNAVASLTVSKHGAGDAVPYISEVNEFIKERGITF